MFSSFIFANEVVCRWGLLPFLSSAIVIPSECGLYYINPTPDKSVVPWDDNTVLVYSKEQLWRTLLFHQPNCPQAWMKMHGLSAVFRETVKVRLQRADVRARQSCLVMIELLPQHFKMLTELCSLGRKMQGRWALIRGAIHLKRKTFSRWSQSLCFKFNVFLPSSHDGGKMYLLKRLFTCIILSRSSGTCLKPATL